MARRFPRLLRSFLLLLVALAVTAASSLDAQVRVRGYTRRDGTYVQPYVRTYPDGIPYNNYSFPGNYNPNTGRITTGNPATYLQNYYGRSFSSTYASPTPYPAVSTIQTRPWALGSRSSAGRSQTTKVPANAHLDGYFWECNTGFQQVGSGCTQLPSGIPANAHLDGYFWECNRGYTQVGRACIRR